MLTFVLINEYTILVFYSMKFKRTLSTLSFLFVTLLLFSKYITQADFSLKKENNISGLSTKKIELPKPLNDRSELILHRKGYTVSYNSKNKIPNWVAWELTPKRLEERYSRTNKFLPDPDIQKPVTSDDYKGAHIDRGHMCPAGDNRWDKQAMMESFYMTNICPQDHNLNRGDWKELEEACRLWAQKEGRIYIVCGPILYNQNHRTISKQRIVVPEAFFKVVLCMGKQPKAIGFIHKNTPGNRPLDSYVNSIDEVERITGIDFFPSLPDELEKNVEKQCNLQQWKRQ